MTCILSDLWTLPLYLPLCVCFLSPHSSVLTACYWQAPPCRKSHRDKQTIIKYFLERALNPGDLALKPGWNNKPPPWSLWPSSLSAQLISTFSGGFKGLGRIWKACWWNKHGCAYHSSVPKTRTIFLEKKVGKKGKPLHILRLQAIYFPS